MLRGTASAGLHARADLTSGLYHFFVLQTKQLIDCFRMSGSAIALAFTPSGEHLLSAGSKSLLCVSFVCQ